MIRSRTGARLGAVVIAAMVAMYVLTGTSDAVVDVTPPVIQAVLNPAPIPASGWYTGNVTLTWSVTDPESPGSIVKTGCVNQNVTADRAIATYSCSATSDGGSVLAPLEVTFGRDATKPVISANIVPAPVNGWNTTDVTVGFACTDATSGVAYSSVAGRTVTAEGISSVANDGICGDHAGNTADPVSVSVKIDKTPPVAVLTVTAGTAGTNGWYTSAVTVTASGTDAGSGGVTCTTPTPGTTQTADTAGVVFNTTCTDVAGLTDAATPLTVKVDKTGPTLAPTFSVTVIDLLESVTATPHATDATSGVASEACPAVPTTATGHFTIECTATDRAGNTTKLVVGYDVIAAAGTVLFGSKPPAAGGFGTFAFGGGTFEQLLSASGCPRASSVFFYNKADGGFAVWIPGATVAAVNAEILALFAGSPPLPAGVIFTARCV